MNESRQLAEFIAATRYPDLPPTVVEKAKLFILDDIASAFIGSDTPWCRMVAEMVQDAGGKEECTVVGREWRANPAQAALINGTAVGGFETDHSFSAGSAHPSASVFPAALAMSEQRRVSGKHFITSLVLGYETTCRVGEAATRSVEDDRGFHGPGTNGPFGGAAAAAKAMKLDAAKTLHALGIAGSHAAGLREFALEGAMTKRIHLGRATQFGLESALLAEKGLTGPSTVLEGKFGFFNVYSPTPHPEKLLEGLGRDYRMTGVRLKSYACYGAHQAIMQQLLKFKAEHPQEARAIQRIKVSGSRHMVFAHDSQEPTTILGMQYSLPFAAAIAMARDITNPLIFSEQTLWDKEVRALAKKIETAIDSKRFGQYAGDPRAEIIVEASGRSYTLMAVENYKGSALNPFTLEDMGDRLHVYAGQFIGPERVKTIIDQVHHMEDIKDISQFAGLLSK